MNKTYYVDGMSCVICKNNVEGALLKVSGVKTAKVNLIENEVKIEYDEKNTIEKELYDSVNKAGYKLIDKNSKNNIIDLKLILSIVLIILMIIIYNSNLSYLIIGCIHLVLASVIILLNFNIYKSGFKSLISFKPNMNSLVFISSFTSYIYSIYVLYKLFNHSDIFHIYFETSAMILTFVSIGKKIENNTKLQTGKVIRGLSSLIPMQANLIIDNQIKIIPINELKKDDVVLVKPGESIPQDGIIVKGITTLDESMLTGESLPLEKTIDDEVIGGTINLTGSIEVKINKVSSLTTISKIINLTKSSTDSKLPIERITDRISKYFVYAIISISLLTFIIWFINTKNIELSLNFALSVLVISCPCSLGLATPAAIAVANGRAAKEGILLKNPEILEIARNTKTAIFDKTGTLTNNKLNIIETKEFDKDFIKIITSLESNNNHPIAKTIKEKYKTENIIFDSNKIIDGKGIEAKLNNDIYCVGNNKLINIPEEYINYARTNNYSYIAASKNNILLGIIYLSDSIRENSFNAIQNLKKRKIKTIMCTGDNETQAKIVSNNLNIDNYYSNIKPEDKNEILKKEKENGITMMIGDGINDAIALANADISITIKDSSDIATASSDIILMKSDLNDLSFIYDLSIKTMKIIKQNLVWALLYNTLLIPVAAGVFYNSLLIGINPVFGTIAMFISSTIVLLNALRINNIKKED